MALFAHPPSLSAGNGGAISYALVQSPPDGSSMSGGRVGTGPASGDTVFTMSLAPRHFLPTQTYFRLRGHAVATFGGQATLGAVTTAFAMADNWPAACFQVIRCYLDGNLLEECLFNAQTDTIATYSCASKSWLDSFGSVCGVGMSYTDRLALTAALPFGTAAGGGVQNYFEAAFRPALSIFNIGQAIKMSQLRFIFSWNPNAEQNMVGECIQTAFTANTNYAICIDEFVVHVATVAPDPSIALQKTVLLDLTPCRTQLITFSTTQISQNVSVPSSTFRLCFALQPSNAGVPTSKGQTTNTLAAGVSTAGVAFSWPITWFSTLGLTQFRWSSTALGLTAPIPDYAPNFVTSASSAMRCYRDFADTVQGTSAMDEGSIPFGTADGLSLVPAMGYGALTVATSGLASGAALTVAPTAVTAFGTTQEIFAGKGYRGRYPILAFPVVKPAAAKMNSIDVFATFAAASTANTDAIVTAAGGSYNLYIAAFYHAAAALHYDESGAVARVEIQLNQ